jgi:hypothetical protein
MKKYIRKYQYEAEQKCCVYNCDNLADVEVVKYYNCIYLRIIQHLK